MLPIEGWGRWMGGRTVPADFGGTESQKTSCYYYLVSDESVNIKVWVKFIFVVCEFHPRFF